MNIKDVLGNFDKDLESIKHESGVFYENYKKEQMEMKNLLLKYENSTEIVSLLEQDRCGFYGICDFPCSIMNIREIKAFLGKKSGKIGHHCYRIILRGCDWMEFYDWDDDIIVDLSRFKTFECHLIRL